MSIRRYRVLAAPGRDFRDAFEKGVRAHALVPLDPKNNPHEEKSIGWCSLHDENDLDLWFEKFWLDGRILLGLRVDVIKPPPGEVRRRLLRRRREEEEKRKAPLSRAELRDLKELIIAELRVSTPPRVRTTDVVWNIDEQTLYFFSQSKGLNEIFTDLFVQTFGVAVDFEGPGSWAQLIAEEDGHAGALRKVQPTAALLAGFAGLRPGVRDIDEMNG